MKIDNTILDNTVKRQRPLSFSQLALALLLAALFTPAIALGDELDDISIQVIGLDEIPEQALEHIPMPSPDFGGLTDIRQSIIPRQDITPGAGDSVAITAPAPVAGGTDSPQ